MRLKLLAFALALLVPAAIARADDAPKPLFVDPRSTTVQAAERLEGEASADALRLARIPTAILRLRGMIPALAQSDLDIRVIASAGTGPARLEDRIALAVFYRVAAVHPTMPPLRDRREDIPALFAHHIGQAIAALGVPRKTFHYCVKKLNLDLADLKRSGPGGVPRER